jgi:anti-anti-sigma factor
MLWFPPESAAAAVPERHEGNCMDCQISRSDDAALVVIIGSLDSSWSSYLGEKFDEVVRSGAHEMHVDMSGVSYLSSNGIAVLLRCHRQMRQIGGRFRIVANSDAVGDVLKLTGVLKLLMDEEAAASVGLSPAPAAALAGVALEGEALTMRVFSGSRASCGETLELYGDAARLARGGYDQRDDQLWRALRGRVAIGLGALGPDFEACRDRFGEFLAADGVAAYRPSEGRSRPDFEQATGAFVPEVHMLYGMAFRANEGATMVRFEARGDPDLAAVRLSELARTACSQAASDTVGMILIGETAGLVGTALRRSPVGVPGGVDLFERTHAREWLSLTSEPEFARSTALVVGVATRGSSRALAPFVRPLSGKGPTDLRGHFHAAVVPYRPLPRGSLALAAAVQLLFEPGRVETVLHLLDDSRPIVGAGESAFTRGVFWVVPLAAERTMVAK